MKRILFVIPYLYGGGAERVVSVWASELARFGCDVHLLLFYHVENEYYVDDRVIIHTLADGKEEYKRWSKLGKLKAIRQVFKTIKPDVVLPFVTYVGISVNIARIGLSIKVIETIRIDPRYAPRTILGRIIRNLSVYTSKRCIVQTDTQLQYFPKWIQNRMKTFPNPISAEFTQKEKEFTDKRIRNIVAVGRLEKQKNYPMLISAFSQIAENNKEISLRIYGEGSLYNELNDYINEHNLKERVLLCGRTNNIAKVLQKSDLFILSSEAEGMPNSLMEAMLVGLPCISTNCPTGPAELIEDGFSGYLIPVGDKRALTDSIVKMINNIDDSIEMGKRARETILNRYAAQVSAKELMRFIESI